VTRPRTLTALVALALLAVLAPASASAAKRSVPQAFYGANWDNEISENAPASLVDAQWARMARSGVEATRTSFVWATAQPDPGGPIGFARTDRLVTLATLHGIELLPIVILAPPWARENGADFSPPRNPAEYAAYLTALVRRYGPQGSFWGEHPELKKRPLRKWQIWNEPHLGFQWTKPENEDYAKGYGALLRPAYRAVHAADPHASVVLAGLSNYSWRYLEDLYSRGHIRGYYDIAAVHPYTRTASGVVEIARRFRAVMAKHHDGRKRLWITELGLPASRGKQDSNNVLQTTDSGMAKFLTGSYAGVANTRRRLSVGVSRVYWYTWASTYCCDIFRYTGLLAYNNKDSVAARPAYTAYVRSARRAEGCTKADSGACR
jgi:hypothetical protein